MQFLKEKQRVKLKVQKARAGGNDEKRKISVEFALAIDAEIARSLPKNIQDEYRGMKSAGTGVTTVEFSNKIESQNIRFFRLPTKGAELDFDMENADLENLRLERSDAKDVFFVFRVQYSMTKSAWSWLWYSFSREVFAEFEECQTELPMEDGKPVN